MARVVVPSFIRFRIRRAAPPFEVFPAGRKLPACGEQSVRSVKRALEPAERVVAQKREADNLFR